MRPQVGHQGGKTVIKRIIPETFPCSTTRPNAHRYSPGQVLLNIYMSIGDLWASKHSDFIYIQRTECFWFWVLRITGSNQNFYLPPAHCLEVPCPSEREVARLLWCSTVCPALIQSISWVDLGSNMLSGKNGKGRSLIPRNLGSIPVLILELRHT